MNFRKLLSLSILGALIGGCLSSWLAPKMISWYFNPPVAFGVNCTESIEWALNKMRVAQMVSVGIGAAGGAILYCVYVLKRKKNPETAEPQ